MTVSGNIPVSYHMLPGGAKGTDETVRLMARMAGGRYGSRSPKIRAAALNIIRDANVREKDYHGEGMALAKWVRDNIRYLKDPLGQETLAHPEETMFNSLAGDCDDQSVLTAALLGAVGIPTRFKVMGVTPAMFSHVYLQMCPKDRWITIDPIMSDKPIGWEAPKRVRAIEKVYPVNGPDGWVGEPTDHMDGLGRIGVPRVRAPFELPNRASRERKSPYVEMPAMLPAAWNAPLDPLMAFPPDNRQIPAVRQMDRIDPQLQRMGPPATMPGEIPYEEQHPAVTAAYEGQHGVFLPDDLAGIRHPIHDSMPVASMQRPVVAQIPEGVDHAFTRANLVVDPAKGDKISFYGQESLAERPPIRAIPLSGDPNSMLPGMGEDPNSMLPGMGSVGMGLTDGTTGTQRVPTIGARRLRGPADAQVPGPHIQGLRGRRMMSDRGLADVSIGRVGLGVVLASIAGFLFLRSRKG